ncbi:hypothetical protein [Xylanibacter oryzae]|uniref:hypothetical protein n=1 Tax=Xylanibacter oryzae TaxID=185293 RepID=UPI0004AD04E0|nr:hypothetical protein [Xylanibacter oryzae]
MKAYIIISAILFSIALNAQNKEPEFIGEVNLIKCDSTLLLDKEYLKTNTSADASLLLFGIGSARTKIEVTGRYAHVRIDNNQSFHLIAKSIDNNSDPMSVVRIFQFAVYHDTRKAEIASSDVYGGISNGKLRNVSYKASKYGNSSYDISFTSLPTGEYGVMVFNPNNRDSHAILIYCFGVGHPKKHRGWVKYGSDGVYY